MQFHAFIALLIFAVCAVAAPIPKFLKKRLGNTDYEGYWEQTGSNSDGKEGGITHGRFWKIENDKFYYNLKDMDLPQSSNKGPLSTPDENVPQIKLFNDTRCRLEINDDVLTWVFGNNKADPLDNCDPAAQRIIYYFKRVK
jgi:hypothetical protein